ncbi:MAG TPA: hypothetical protein P5059_02555 [Candidatus Dojkabacteria bacterium]|nr:hypothetical protein [Candidatus Dojkabacteria bacterium]
MSKRNLILLSFGIIVLSLVGFFLIRGNDKTEQIVYEDTIKISKQYLGLRYKTDNVLVNAKEYESYDAWDTDVLSIIQEWEELGAKVLKLEENAEKISQEKTAFNFSSKVYAYDTKEVQAVIESAPAGKTIRTLAKHFGVDVKKAQLILNQSQDMATREAWGEAGDAFEKLENQAIVIKDSCKVAVYVGGVVATGGAAGFATAGTLAQVTVVATGVDLALEVTEDGAQIALGDKNKVSSFVKDVRTVTEPIATVLTITNIPSNLGKAIGKFEAVNVGLEQLRASAQEGKVIGIDLKNFEYNPPFQVIKNTKYPGEVTVAELERAEVEDWIKSINKDYKPMTNEEVKEFVENIELEEKESVVEESEDTSNVESNEEEEEEFTEESTPKGEISYSEWDNWGDEDSRYKGDLIEKFGDPDVITTNSSGKEVWIYLDLVYNSLGNTCSPVYTFYSTDQTATRKCESKVNVDRIINNN